MRWHCKCLAYIEDEYDVTADDKLEAEEAAGEMLEYFGPITDIECVCEPITEEGDFDDY